MSNTVQLDFNEECLNYDLYISSKHRRSMFVDSSRKNDKSTLRISMLKLMNNTSHSSYLDLLNSTKKMMEEQEMIFLGVSNDAFIGILAGKIVVDTVNKQLSSMKNGALVKRVVLTDSIGEKDAPRCYPLLENNSFYHKPNYSPPSGSLNWENHIAVYKVDEPDKYYFPDKDTNMVFETEINGENVKATVS